jgi:hypothetical protein
MEQFTNAAQPYNHGMMSLVLFSNYCVAGLYYYSQALVAAH